MKRQVTDAPRNSTGRDQKGNRVLVFLRGMFPTCRTEPLILNLLSNLLNDINIAAISLTLIAVTKIERGIRGRKGRRGDRLSSGVPLSVSAKSAHALT